MSNKFVKKYLEYLKPSVVIVLVILWVAAPLTFETLSSIETAGMAVFNVVVMLPVLLWIDENCL